jgi:cupin 2 domain-containing protein
MSFGGNLLSALPDAGAGEALDALVEGGRFRLLRIVSAGQATPAGQWYDQGEAEWVLLLAGAAGIAIEGEAAPRRLFPGDWLGLPAHCRHRVEWTAPDAPTVWLALHYEAADGATPASG